MLTLSLISFLHGLNCPYLNPASFKFVTILFFSDLAMCALKGIDYVVQLFSVAVRGLLKLK